MADVPHGVLEKICEFINDIETENHGECENKNIFDCGLSAVVAFHG